MEQSCFLMFTSPISPKEQRRENSWAGKVVDVTQNMRPCNKIRESLVDLVAYSRTNVWNHKCLYENPIRKTYSSYHNLKNKWDLFSCSSISATHAMTHIQMITLILIHRPTQNPVRHLCTHNYSNYICQQYDSPFILTVTHNLDLTSLTLIKYTQFLFCSIPSHLQPSHTWNLSTASYTWTLHCPFSHMWLGLEIPPLLTSGAGCPRCTDPTFWFILHSLKCSKSMCTPRAKQNFQQPPGHAWVPRNCSLPWPGPFGT